ncbi:MAG: dTDP-4-dehydrorhamnose reductase [Saprospiraceae bacterium]|nr:MAG: dTDP-4-dehydrorhamnose reductase [Saprospiraceae bacterium]
MQNKKKKILVTGANGQVGMELKNLAAQFPEFDFTWVDVAELDITDREAVGEFFAANPPDYCLNCAAYTAVDRAEEQPDLAWRVNSSGVEHLAEACKPSTTKLIQLSTDYVYHTNQNTPFIEGDPASPQGIYARTKLAGDDLALKNGGMVIRTSWVYSSFGNNFVKTMLRLSGERQVLSVVFDQIGTPTYAADLAQAMLTMIQKVERGEVPAEKLMGLYHFSNEGVTSWYDFAKAIFEIKNKTVKVQPIESKDFPTLALRPPFSVLNKGKIKATFGLEIPHWRESLRTCLERL